MLLFETPLMVAAIATAFLTLQCVIGGRFLDRIWPGVFLGPIGRRVLGALLVYSLLILGQFVGWAVFGFAYTWVLVALVVVPVFGMAAAAPRLTEQGAESRDESTSWVDAAVLLFGALAFLLNDFGWITPLAIAAAIVALVAHFAGRLHRIVVGVSAAILLVVGVVVSLRIRSELWWFLTDDYWMFDALISSLKSVGPFEEYSTLGPATWQYHIASYQYVAFIEQLTNAQPMILLSRVMPVASAVFASGATMAFLSRHTNLGRQAQLACIVVFALTYRYTFQSPSYAVGFAVLVAATMFWLNRDELVRFSHWVVVIPTMIASAIATKFSNLFIIAVVVAASVLLRIVREKCFDDWNCAASVALGATLVCTVFIVLFSPRVQSELSSYSINGFGREFLGDYASIGSFFWRHYALSSVLIALITPIAFALIILHHARREWCHATELRVSGTVAVVLALLFGLLGGNAAGRYFVESALTVGSMVAIVVLASIRTRMTLRNVFCLLVCAIIGVASVSIRPLINGSSDWETVLRAMVVNGSGIIAVPLISLAVPLYFKKSPRSRSIASLLLVGVLTINFSADVAGLRNREVGTPMGSSPAEYGVARGSGAEQTVAEWLRMKSPKSALVGSNYFCDRCIGEDWIMKDTNSFSSGRSLEFGWGGSNYVLPALSERLFVIQGPRFVAGSSGLSPESRARLRLSLEFANRSSVRAREELRERGVDYFIIDRRTATSDSWRSFGRIEFENERFSVVNLSKD